MAYAREGMAATQHGCACADSTLHRQHVTGHDAFAGLARKDVRRCPGRAGGGARTPPSPAMTRASVQRLALHDWLLLNFGVRVRV